MTYIISGVFLTLFVLFHQSIAQCSRKFPDYFQFGAATSAYQVEGAWNVDGKGLSIWDVFTHEHSELIANGANGDDACKSYYFYKDDIKALTDLGLNFYRFSFSWSRILPNGDTSVINEIGLQYYDNLINELLANNIEPMATIFHWDLPQTLEDLGGLLNRNITDYFTEYARVLFDRYSDRVKLWTTINEPYSYCQGGYSPPTQAPYVNEPGVGNYICGENILIAHANIYHLYRDNYYTTYGGRFSFNDVCFYAFPKNPNSTSDVAAAERYMQFYCGWFAHPVYSKEGGYPEVMVDYIAMKSKDEGRITSRLPQMSDELKQYIQGTADFFALNYYSSTLVQNYVFQNFSSNSLALSDANILESANPAWPKAASPWLYSVPEGFRGILNWIKNQYNNPDIKITENGWSESISAIHDVRRIAYYTSHFEAMLDAMDDGCNVTAHTSWSLIDTFEWDSAYTRSYGIYQVNFTSPNRERTPKDSAMFHKYVSQTRCIPEAA